MKTFNDFFLLIDHPLVLKLFTLFYIRLPWRFSGQKWVNRPGPSIIIVAGPSGTDYFGDIFWTKADFRNILKENLIYFKPSKQLLFIYFSKWMPSVNAIFLYSPKCNPGGTTGILFTSG